MAAVDVKSIVYSCIAVFFSIGVMKMCEAKKRKPIDRTIEKTKDSIVHRIDTVKQTIVKIQKQVIKEEERYEEQKKEVADYDDSAHVAFFLNYCQRYDSARNAVGN
jgi:phage shock protein A